MTGTSPQPHPRPDHQRVIVEIAGPGEWIVAARVGGRPLHVYRLAPGDWLVSEVGRGTEGRGVDLEHAIAALSASTTAPIWWRSVVAELGSCSASHG